MASINLDPDRPNLIFVNAGETHYPYLLPTSRLPHLPGAHGAGLSATANADVHPTFSADDLLEMHAAQTRAVTVADRRVGLVLEDLPRPTLFVVTADHGELFGEDGMFGHGPFWHPTLFEVPFAMGFLT